MIPARDPAKIFIAARLIVLIVVCIAMAILTRSDEYGFVFLNGTNLLNIVRNASILIIIAVGQTITLTAKDVDLSVGSVLSLTSVLAAIMLKNYEFGVPAAILAALLVGAFLGFINGLLITYLGLPPFLATYGMLWVLFGFAYLILRGNVIYGFPATFRVIGNGHLFGIPMPIIVMLIVFIASYFILYHTTLGRRFFATGANIETAKIRCQGQQGCDYRLRHQRLSGGIGWPGSDSVYQRLRGADRRQLPDAGAGCCSDGRDKSGGRPRQSYGHVGSSSDYGVDP
jgi:ribose/xylose/arabinose/galactoside ABC-type transport system permease subunit